MMTVLFKSELYIYIQNINKHLQSTFNNLKELLKEKWNRLTWRFAVQIGHFRYIVSPK